MSDDLETQQLKAAIVALREELERARFEEREHIQQAVAAASDEMRQLRASVVKLREELELQEAQRQNEVRDLDLHHEREKAELRHTILKLREALEQLNESVEKANSAAAAPSR